MIVLSHVAKTFPGRPHGVTVFRDLSCFFPPGRITGLTGPNGCGKSTLLRLIAGLDTPDAGRIDVGVPQQTPSAGRGPAPSIDHLEASSYPQPPPDAPLSETRDPRAWCAWTPETPLLARHLSGRRHLLELGLWSGASPVQAAAILDSVRRIFPPIASFWDRPAHVYSRGQAALVALARVLMTPRPVWLLDEPTAGLDQETADLVRGWLRQEAQGGRTIVLCTHLPDDITGLCHQILRLADDGVHTVAPTGPAGAPSPSERVSP